MTVTFIVVLVLFGFILLFCLGTCPFDLAELLSLSRSQER